MFVNPPCFNRLGQFLLRRQLKSGTVTFDQNSYHISFTFKGSLALDHSVDGGDVLHSPYILSLHTFIIGSFEMSCQRKFLKYIQWKKI